MKEDYTDITIVLDRSGSMSSIAQEAIKGYNEFLDAQKELPGDCTLTLSQFDHVIEDVYNGVPLEGVPPLDENTFVPRGRTALLDAIGTNIVATGQRLAALDEDQRPGKVIFVILTDGYENASADYSNNDINEKVQHQRDTYKWEFVFLAADQDAIASASRVGIDSKSAYAFKSSGASTLGALSKMSESILRYRSGKSRKVEFEDAGEPLSSSKSS